MKRKMAAHQHQSEFGDILEKRKNGKVRFKKKKVRKMNLMKMVAFEGGFG
jgi:predicted PP-loop superfamily ATPase